MENKYYTGVEVIHVSEGYLDKLYQDKKIKTKEAVYGFEHLYFENTYVVLKNEGGSSSALAIKKGDYFYLLSDYSKGVYGIKPRNKEQSMSLDALVDDTVPVTILTGQAGVGKSLLSIAVALSKLSEQKYSRIIYSRPMTQLGKWGLGYLPGTSDEKFEPYLQGFFCNAETIFDGNKRRVKTLVADGLIEFLPLQLFRGASFHQSIVIIDECQNLDAYEMLSVGTRVAEGSKLILLGDLNQRDEKIKKTETGLYKICQSNKMKNSPLVSYIELRKSERGTISSLFADVFSDLE